MHVALDAPLGLHGATDLAGGLEHEDVPAGVGQGAGGDQPVGAGPDDDGVRDLLLHAPIVPHGAAPMHRPVRSDRQSPATGAGTGLSPPGTGAAAPPWWIALGRRSATTRAASTMSATDTQVVTCEAWMKAS